MLGRRSPTLSSRFGYIGRRNRSLLLLLTAAGLLATSALAAEDDDAELSLEPTRTIAFTTHEGTYMDLDVSPDGTQITFALLGDIYTLPIAGGSATRLTSGMSYDIQPAYSPDGKSIAFVSDRSGSDNLWVVGVDGSDLEQITSESDEVVSNPEWAPEGDYLLARRSGDLWLYHVDGGSGIQLTESDLARGLTGPTFGPAGRHVYFSSSGGGSGQGLGRVNGWQVRRLDRHTGDVATITASPNGAYRPLLSPDGQWLVYGARVDAETGLRVRELATSRERWLAWPIDRDNAERPSILDLMPRYSFTPDSAAVIVATGGTFHRIEIADGTDTPITFEARVEQELGPLVFFPSRHADGPVQARNIRYAGRSPDGGQLVFSALGRIWKMALPGGTPERISSMDVGQFHPVISPDGEWVAWVTWDDEQGGHLWKGRLGAEADAAPIRLTEHAGYYQHPSWSPDGRRIAMLREDPATFRNIWSRNTGMIVWVPADGGALQEVVSAPSDNRLTFDPRGERISFVADVDSGAFDGSRPPQSELVSVRLDGTDRRTLARIKAETWEAVPSPDGRWVAWATREDIYVAAVPLSPEPPEIGEQRGPGPVARVTREGGVDVHWSAASEALAWSFGNSYYTIALETVFAEPETEPEPEPEADDAVAAAETEPESDPGESDRAVEEAAPEADVLMIELYADRAAPTGMLALVGGTAVTMAGDEIIDDATVLIENNRIRAIGPRGEVTVPAEAEVVDVAGKWLTPGIIDLHAHLRPPREVFVQGSWSYLANLAYGVTSTRDVSTSNDSFAYAELVETGQVVGPRIYSTGRAMTPGNAKIEDLDDARTMVRHYKRLGTDVVKQYMQPHRRQRQWVIEAAREEQMNVTNEGGGDFRLNMTQVLDGYTGVEHSLPLADIYDDVVQLVARSGTWYTPTLVVSYGGPTAEWYFYQTTEVHDDEKLARFTPHDDLDRRTRRGQMNALDEYHFVAVSEGAARILQAGGRVGLGAHGEQQGICAHWELWALQMGGLTNHDAWRTATSLAAEGLGRLEDLGTLETGKLADLLVLDADPMASIRNSTAIRYVIKNGELFDAETMDSLWPEPRTRPAIGQRDVGAPPR